MEEGLDEEGCDITFLKQAHRGGLIHREEEERCAKAQEEVRSQADAHCGDVDQARQEPH